MRSRLSVAAAFLIGCGAGPKADAGPAPGAAGDAPDTADVVQVEARAGRAGASFSVTVRSPDTGCDRYADWWEVVSTEGALLYRRILLHSHVGEQPFTRSGGPVPTTDDEVVVVRAHLNTGGYGAAMRGSISGGFAPAELEPGFGAALESAAPKPTGCAF